MITGTKAIMRTTRLGLLLLLATAAGGCMEIEQPNQPPTAAVQVLVDGTALAPEMVMGVTPPAYVIMGAPATVTLQGTATDPDGEVTEYEWWRTDVSRAMRNGTDTGMGAAGAGGMAPPPPPPFTGDPPGTATVTVELPVVGNYRYSLWATDDGGLASTPATVTLVVR
jgi:hypothetical protein